MKLSILIPSIHSRSKMASKLVDELTRQKNYCHDIHPTLGAVEIVLLTTKEFLKGGLSIGAKRGKLLDMAKGDYVCFLDDDEWVSPDYVETLLRMVYFNPDVATFRSIAMLANNWALIDMSLANPNEQINPDTITRRKPWHVCPVKAELAKMVDFTESNYGEDWVWFEQVLEFCNTQQHTDKVIHNYRHGAHSEADKITHGVH